ncbi:MAG: NYN domain-containing protein [Candidatus Sericytochromatia bacterium]|nr:NYN domain-containing protein [Candidatus Sericytochromatia bacterium]
MTALRTAIFMDGAYLDHLAQGPWAEGTRPLALDMRRVPKFLNGGLNPKRVFYYHALPWVSEPPLPAEHHLRAQKEKFLAFLAADKRWVLREGRVERRGGHRPGDWIFEQKRTDVQMAVDLTRLAWRGEIDRAILVSGDSDLIPAVEDARTAGIRVTLACHAGSIHRDLMTACNETFLLLDTEMRQLVRR